jgi:hypothetical protein
MGRADLIGSGAEQLVPARQPAGWVEKAKGTARPKQRAGRGGGGAQRFTTKGVGFPGEK